MKLFLLRHGRSVANERQLVCGAADYPLSLLGMEQARRVAIQLGSISFTRIYCSSLSRALDTASGFVRNVSLSVEEGLCELDTGEVSDITLPELWRQEPRFRSPWLFPDLRYPGGETFREMFCRISGWFDQRVVAWNDDDKVLIVGHEGTLRSIYSRLLELPIEKYPDFPIGNCDYLYFEVCDGALLHYEHVALCAADGEAV